MLYHVFLSIRKMGFSLKANELEKRKIFPFRSLLYGRYFRC